MRFGRRRVVVSVLAVSLLGLGSAEVSAQSESPVEDESAGVAAVAVDPPALPQGERDLKAELGGPVGPVEQAIADARVEVSNEIQGPYDPRSDRPVDELEEFRGEGAETFELASGRKVTEILSEPKWFKADDGSWALVDPTVVANDDGSFRNAGASFAARFGTSGEGVAVSFEERSFTLRLVGRGDVRPEADRSDRSVVWYRELAPGVDGRFTVAKMGIKQDYVVRDKEALAALESFDVGVESAGRLVAPANGRGGLAWDWDGDGKTGFDGDTGEPKVRVADPVVFDAVGQPIVEAKARLVVPEGEDRAEIGGTARVRPVSVAFERDAVASLDASRFPVTVDPLFEIIPASMGGGWQSNNSAGNVVTGSNQWGLLGNWRIYGGDDYFRYNIQPGYQYLWTNVSSTARVFFANFKMVNAQYPTNAAPFTTSWNLFPTNGQGTNAAVCHASAWSYAGAYPGVDVNKCRDWYYAGVNPTYSAVGGYPSTTYVDVTNMIRPWVAAQDPNGVLGVSVDVAPGWYNFASTIPSLEIFWDSPAPAPSVIAPVDGATVVSPSGVNLSVNAVTDVDAGQNPPLYNFMVFAGKPASTMGTEPRENCGQSSALWSSGYQQNVTSQTIPDGVLQDGVTYWWTVATMGYTLPGYPTCPGPWKFKVDRRLGNSGVSPMTQAGPFAINTANGNVMAGGGTHQIATLGGGIGVGLTYNSQAKTENGLRAQYFGGTIPEWFQTMPSPAPSPGSVSWAPGAVPFSTRVDDNIDFNWSDTGPLSGDRLDNWLARWTGYVTVPATGAYCFGAKADDGTRIWVGGTLVHDSWADQGAADRPCSTNSNFTAGVPQTIRVEYYDRTVTASIQLKTYNGSAGGDGVVPSSWLSTELDTTGPGWTMSTGAVSITGARITGSGVTLTRSDGSMAEFVKSPSGAYTGEPGDGTRVWADAVSGEVSVSDDSGTTFKFDKDGLLTSAVSAVDDRQPAATQMLWSGNPVRLTGMRDPVTNDTVTLNYGGDAACTAAPSGFAIAPGLLCKVTTFDNRVTDLFYASGRLARIVQPGGATVDYGYDGSNRITSVRDSLAFDMIGAGLRANDATATWQVAYDGSGRATTITAPAPTTGATRQATTIGYVSAATPSTLGESTVTVSGVTNPQGWSTKARFDHMFRTREAFDQLNRKSESFYDGATDRVNYSKSLVGTSEELWSSTIYETDVVFNGLARPVTQYGPAPPSAWTVTNGVATPNLSMPVPTTQTAYDQGINGLSVAWFDDNPVIGTIPNRAAFVGAPKRHSLISSDLAFNWGVAAPYSDMPADNWSSRWSGLINLATAGSYQFQTSADDGIRITIDDQVVINAWTQANTLITSPATTFSAGWHRIVIEYREDNGGAGFTVNWKPPSAGGFSFVPVGVLKPDLGLVTTSTAASGIVTTTGYADPTVGLPTATTVDPGNLALTTSTAYEAPGVGSFLRRTSRTLPAGASTTNTYTNYTAAATASIPASCSAIGLSGTNIKQAGLLQKSTAADPDANAGTGGVNAPIVRETIYDASRRPTASRVEADGSSGWVCTSYDTRGRPAQQFYPAWGGVAARTVTFSYNPAYGAAPADPSVVKVTDNSLPAGQQDTFTKVDLLGRAVESVDVWGTKTVTSYDVAGRVTQAVVSRSGTTLHTFTYVYLTSGSGVNQLSTVTFTPAGGSATVMATVAYDSAGRESTITYANGTTKTAPTYDAYQRPISLGFNQTGGTLLTSNGVTRDIAGRVVDFSVDGVDPNTGGNNYTYDTAGRLTSYRTPGAGATTTDRWDNWNGSGAGSQPAGCTGPGNLAGKNSNRLADGHQGWGFCYDWADRLTKVSGSGSPDTISYDTHGNMVAMGNTAAGTVASYGFDVTNRHVSTIANNRAVSVTYGRDATDRIVERAGISRVGTAQNAVVSGSSLLVTKPPWTTAGDVGVISVVASGTTAVPAPSGWVLRASRAGATTWSGVFTRTLAAGDGDVNMSLGTTRAAAGSMSVYRGVDTANPVDANAGATTTSTTSHTAPSVNVTGRGSRVLTVTGTDGWVDFFADSNSTETADVTTGWWNVNLHTAERALVGTFGTTATGTTTATSSGAVSGTALTVVLKPQRMRQGYTGAGDTSDLTYNEDFTLAERTLGLPGGVLVTWRGATNQTWSYPNMHGDVVAEANHTGTKQGATRNYTAWGVATGTIIDNQAGSFDFAWHGQAQRPLDTQTGLANQYIEMGARMYFPQLGRFTETDPIEGGTANDYTYSSDPTNSSDLSGLFEYTLTFDLGKSAYSPEGYFNLVKWNFGKVFPIGGAPKRLPGAGTDVDLNVMGLPFPVRVEGVTKTGWKFTTRPGHPDYPGTVEFDFYKSKGGRMRLRVHGVVPDYAPGAFVFCPVCWLQRKSIYREIARTTWTGFQRNLRNQRWR